MNVKLTVALIAALGLGACTTAEEAALIAAREGAKAVVTPIVADTIPGPAGVILTDCIIDNASAEELAQLALTGASPEMVTLVSQILQRPETVACATSGLT